MRGRISGMRGRIPGMRGRISGMRGRIPGMRGRIPVIRGRTPANEGAHPRNQGAAAAPRKRGTRFRHDSASTSPPPFPAPAPAPAQAPRMLRDRGLLTVSLGTALFLAALAARGWHAGHLRYGFLIWNLFLAWVPLLLALVAEPLAARRRDLSLLAVAAAWLLFLPNAPYVVTDLMHLRRVPPTPLWYDAILLGIAATTGLLAGAFALARMQSAVAVRVSDRASWLVPLVAIPASGLGIYLGRFERLNSWDALLHPLAVLRSVLGSLGPRALVVSAAMAGLFAMVYLALGPTMERSRRRT